MLLKVGELARRSGLSVRTLHHYDSIGLLRPSGRSEGGYRLYAPPDVARLHGIQALRHLGLPLGEIGAMLDAQGSDVPGLLDRQLHALDREIAQAQALRERLALVRAKYTAGGEAGVADWLDTLQVMTACDKYFSAAEIRLIFERWHQVEPNWRPLMAEVRALMDAGVPPLDIRVQPVAQRWSNLLHNWMGGNFDLMLRWGQMYNAEPGAQGPRRPDLAMVRYMEQAEQYRLSLLLRHLSEDDLRRLGPVPDAEWARLSDDVQALIDADAPLQSPEVKAVLKRWDALGRRSTRGDDALRARIQHAYEVEPVLRATAPLKPAARDFLRRAAAAAAAGSAEEPRKTRPPSPSRRTSA